MDTVDHTSFKWGFVVDYGRPRTNRTQLQKEGIHYRYVSLPVWFSSTFITGIAKFPEVEKSVQLLDSLAESYKDGARSSGTSPKAILFRLEACSLMISSNTRRFFFFSTFYYRKLSGIGNIDPAFGFWVGRVWRWSVFLRSFLKYDILCSGSIFVVDFIMCQRRQSFWFHSPYEVYTYPIFAAVRFPFSLVPRDSPYGEW